MSYTASHAQDFQAWEASCRFHDTSEELRSESNLAKTSLNHGQHVLESRFCRDITRYTREGLAFKAVQAVGRN